MKVLERLMPESLLVAGSSQRLASKLRRLLMILLVFMLINALVVLASMYFVHRVNENLSKLESLSMHLAQFDAAQLRFQRSMERADALLARQQLGSVKLLAAGLPPGSFQPTEAGHETSLVLLEREFEAYLLYQEQSAALDSGMQKQLDDLLANLQTVGPVLDHSPLTSARVGLLQAVLRLQNLHQAFLLEPRSVGAEQMHERLIAAREAAQRLRAVSPEVEAQIRAYNIGQQMLQFESSFARQISYTHRKMERAAALLVQVGQLTAEIAGTLERHRYSISRQIVFAVSSSLLASCTILLLGLLLGRRFVHSITAPLTRLVDATDAFVRGHTMPLDDFFSSHDEIEELATSFRYMQTRVHAQIEVIRQSEEALRDRSVQLEQATRETEALNLSLEEKVAARTAELDRAYASLANEHRKLADMFLRLEETQGQLLQSEKMASVGQLAAGVAHEINNPIGFIRSNMNALGEYVQDLLKVVDTAMESAAVRTVAAEVNLDFLRRDVNALLAETREGVERVRAIVDSLREYSHAGEPEWQQSDLLAGLESTVRMLWHEIRLKAELRRELQALPLVRCIPAQINQVFMNLLVNAVQAIPENGVITLRSGQSGESVWLEIEDSGEGMDEAVQRRIFEPFFTTKPVGKGTGLGMSISYEVIKRHGGQLTVRSAPGEGACLRISLPIAGPESEDVGELADLAQVD